MMKISVVTVVYNNADTIKDTINSVAFQTYPEVEHIVVDGSSSDGTLEVIEQNQEKLAKVISEPDDGIYDAMNKGIQAASGKIVGFLNADDVYFDHLALEKVASVFEKEEVDACYGDMVYVDRSDLNRVVRYWKSCCFEDGLFANGWCPAHPTFFVRKGVYERFGGFDLSFEIGNDVELMMRLLERHKIKSIYIPQVLIKMRMGGVSNRSVGNIIRQNKAILLAGKKNNVKISVIHFVMHKLKERVRQYWGKPTIND